jgi:hypothetical protein
MWFAYLTDVLYRTTVQLIQSQRVSQLAELSLQRVTREREAELQHLLCTLLRPQLPFWPRGVRGGGQVKQACVQVPISPYQWQCLTRDTPIHISARGVTERVALLQAHNPIQASLFALRRVRRDEGYCVVLSLSFIYNHRTEVLRVTVRGESYNKLGRRQTLRAVARRAFGAAPSVASSSVLSLY